MNVKIYYIQSESDPSKKYVVRDLLAEGWKCNCPNFLFNERKIGRCKHVQEAIRQQAKENIV